MSEELCAWCGLKAHERWGRVEDGKYYHVVCWKEYCEWRTREDVPVDEPIDWKVRADMLEAKLAAARNRLGMWYRYHSNLFDAVEQTIKDLDADAPETLRVMVEEADGHVCSLCTVDPTFGRKVAIGYGYSYWSALGPHFKPGNTLLFVWVSK